MKIKFLDGPAAGEERDVSDSAVGMPDTVTLSPLVKWPEVERLVYRIDPATGNATYISGDDK